ncbi:cytochrome P450 [Peniophora sp. CONT]|nr:cytochrome P450 [Peniophora sp. CONT]
MASYSHSFIIASTCLSALIIEIIRTSWRRAHTLRGLPTPRTGLEWPWGHEKTVFVSEPGRAYRRWFAECGLTFKIKASLGAPDILVLADPEGIIHLMQKRIYDYHHSGVVRPRVGRALGKGLGWVEGKSEHRRMRRLVSPSLSAENVKAMDSEIRDATMMAIESFRSVVECDHKGVTLDISAWTSKTSLNIIGRAAFRHDFEGGNSSEAQQIVHKRKKGSSPAARFVGFFTLMLLRRFPILNSLPIPAIQAQGLARIAVQNGVARDMIDRNERLEASFHQAEKDLLSRLLLAETQQQVSRSELLEHISTFVIAGHETSANTLAFALWELARHPETQQRLRRELETFPGEPSYEDFQTKLPYLDAVLRETLRLYPAVPYLERVAQKDDIIPLRFPVRLTSGQEVREVIVRPGQTVIIPSIAMQRQEDIWDNPDEFIPDRWLGVMPPREKLLDGWSNTLAFSDGPRDCVGMRLAIHEFKVVISAMIRRFSFADPGDEITYGISSTLQPFVKSRLEDGPQLPIVVSLA